MNKPLMNMRLVEKMIEFGAYVTVNGEVIMSDGLCAGTITEFELTALIHSGFVKVTDADVYVKA